MNTVELFQPSGVNASISIPAEWNEVDQEELLHIAENMLWPYVKPEYFFSAVFFFLLQHRAKLQGIQLPASFANMLNAEDIAMHQGEALEWIRKDNTLTDQIIKSIHVGGSSPTLYGPAGQFNDLSCGEFEDCEVFSHLYNQEKKDDHLLMITAILYRPGYGNWRLSYIFTSWDKVPQELRHLYKEEDDMVIYNAEAAKALFQGVPAQYLLATYLWYTSCRAQLAHVFPHVFGGGGKGEPDIAAFTKCIHAGAGPKNGTRDKIRRSLLKAFLMDMEQDAIYAEELNSKTKP